MINESDHVVVDDHTVCIVSGVTITLCALQTCYSKSKVTIVEFVRTLNYYKISAAVSEDIIET